MSDVHTTTFMMHSEKGGMVWVFVLLCLLLGLIVVITFVFAPARLERLEVVSTEV